MAGRRTHVPKFGNWDANDHMPYTVVFDHARQGRGKPINPNDPQQNPDMFPAQGRSGGGGGLISGRRQFNPNDPEDDGADRNPLPQEKPQPERLQDRNPFPQEKPQPERLQQERQQPERPTVTQQGAGGIVREGSGSGSGPRPGQQQPHQVAAGAAERRRVSGLQQVGNVPSRSQSTENKRPTGNVLDRNAESTSSSFASVTESPVHPSGLQGGRPATTRLGGSSPAYDPTRRKSTGQNEEGQIFAPATPNRSRLSQRNGNNAPLKEEPLQKGPSSALPKFGAWDAQDPGSGDGFTVIFNNARNEKKSGGPVNIPRTPDKADGDLYGDSNHGGVQKGHGGPKSWFCCYGSSNWKA